MAMSSHKNNIAVVLIKNRESFNICYTNHVIDCPTRALLSELQAPAAAFTIVSPLCNIARYICTLRNTRPSINGDIGNIVGDTSLTYKIDFILRNLTVQKCKLHHRQTIRYYNCSLNFISRVLHMLLKGYNGSNDCPAMFGNCHYLLWTVGVIKHLPYICLCLAQHPFLVNLCKILIEFVDDIITTCYAADFKSDLDLLIQVHDNKIATILVEQILRKNDKVKNKRPVIILPENIISLKTRFRLQLMKLIADHSSSSIP